MSDVRLLSIGAAILVNGCAKIVVVRVERAADSQQGVFYALPKTVVRMQLKVDMKKATDAPFSDFAPIFVRGAPVCDTSCVSQKNEDTGLIAPLRSKTTYSLQPGGIFATYGEPDPSNIYLVKFVGRGQLDQSLSMTWTESGLLSSASASVTNRSADIAISGVKLAATLGSKLAFGTATFAPPSRGQNPCPSVYLRTENDKWILDTLRASKSEDADDLVLNYCQLDSTTRANFPNKAPNQAALRRAITAYDQLLSPLVHARIDAIQSRRLLDPVPLITKLDGLIEQQAARLFLGSTETITWDGTFDLRPIASGTVTFGRLNRRAGLCLDKAQIAPESKPIPKGFAVTTESCGGGTPVFFTMKYHPDSATQLFTKIEAKSPPIGEAGFRYRIPAQVRAVLADSGAKAGADYASGVFAIAQLGRVATLPAKRNSKTLSYDLGMVEATGGLKTFKLGTAGGLDAATIDALSGAAGTVVDARNARRKSDSTAADELTVLTREQTLLKLKDEICELQKKYGLTCTVQP